MQNANIFDSNGSKNFVGGAKKKLLFTFVGVVCALFCVMGTKLC